jgi:serine O-acetyltransferase
MIGNHVQFVHGQGIVIGATAVIGDGTRILQQVSVGNNGITEDMPTIGEQVSLMAGAKVIGPITIGDRAVVGANAVVTHEVPPGAIVAGSPARVIGWVDGFGPDTERGLGTDTET